MKTRFLRLVVYLTMIIPIFSNATRTQIEKLRTLRQPRNSAAVPGQEVVQEVSPAPKPSENLRAFSSLVNPYDTISVSIMPVVAMEGKTYVLCILKTDGRIYTFDTPLEGTSLVNPKIGTAFRTIAQTKKVGLGNDVLVLSYIRRNATYSVQQNVSPDDSPIESKSSTFVTIFTHLSSEWALKILKEFDPKEKPKDVEKLVLIAWDELQSALNDHQPVITFQEMVEKATVQLQAILSPRFELSLKKFASAHDLSKSTQLITSIDAYRTWGEENFIGMAHYDKAEKSPLESLYGSTDINKIVCFVLPIFYENGQRYTLVKNDGSSKLAIAMHEETGVKNPENTAALALQSIGERVLGENITQIENYIKKNTSHILSRKSDPETFSFLYYVNISVQQANSIIADSIKASTDGTRNGYVIKKLLTDIKEMARLKKSDLENAGHPILHGYAHDIKPSSEYTQGHTKISVYYENYWDEIKRIDQVLNTPNALISSAIIPCTKDGKQLLLFNKAPAGVWSAPLKNGDGPALAAAKALMAYTQSGALNPTNILPHTALDSPNLAQIIITQIDTRHYKILYLVNMLDTNQLSTMNSTLPPFHFISTDEMDVLFKDGNHHIGILKNKNGSILIKKIDPSLALQLYPYYRYRLDRPASQKVVFSKQNRIPQEEKIDTFTKGSSCSASLLPLVTFTSPVRGLSSHTPYLMLSTAYEVHTTVLKAATRYWFLEEMKSSEPINNPLFQASHILQASRIGAMLSINNVYQAALYLANSNHYKNVVGWRRGSQSSHVTYIIPIAEKIVLEHWNTLPDLTKNNTVTTAFVPFQAFLQTLQACSVTKQGASGTLSGLLSNPLETLKGQRTTRVGPIKNVRIKNGNETIEDQIYLNPDFCWHLHQYAVDKARGGKKVVTYNYNQ